MKITPVKGKVNRQLVVA